MFARAIRKRTEPMIVVANKMDTPQTVANYEEITADPDYEDLRIVPANAHAERALTKAAAGAVDYTAGDDGFEILGNVSSEQATGLERIGEFIEEFEGTGVQRALETAVFDELGLIAVFPGPANGDSADDRFMRDCFLLLGGATTEGSPTSCIRTSARGCSTASTAEASDRSARHTNPTTGTWSRSSPRTETDPVAASRDSYVDRSSIASVSIPGTRKQKTAFITRLISSMVATDDSESANSKRRSRRWNYACHTCGTPFESEPEFCYDCGKDTVAPIDHVLD